MKNIALFASGGGSNAVKIIEHFQVFPEVCVKFVISNNANAAVLNKAKMLGIPCFVFTNSSLEKSSDLLDLLQQNQINLLVLAGYLRKIPSNVVAAYPNAILNIHPALLPDFGGKGMHGLHVHEAVIKAGKKESGITIHYVNEAYDKGQIVFQEKCEVKNEDTPESLAARVLVLEHKNYAAVVEKIIKAL
jgi:phosphoribosylglycinamide formyltransferase-1